VILLPLFSRTTCADSRLRKDRDRSDNENNGEDGAAVTINPFGPLCLLVVIQDCRHQNLNQAKENK
jgi:hypothetical protein